MGMKTLILTPNKNEMCGMYQLAKDLAKELGGDIGFKQTFNKLYTKQELNQYDTIITFMYPLHSIGKWAKWHLRKKWIVYDQKIPPVTKTYFPNFFRRQAMRYINWRNDITKQGADEYWDVTEREQKPRWTEKIPLPFKIYEGVDLTKPYFIYTGRTTDYKNFEWLQQTMSELYIPFIHPENESDEIVHALLSNAAGYATASIWEGYGRPVMEAEALGIPAVAYDVGTHKKHIKKGICVPCYLEEEFIKAVKTIWDI